MSDARPVPDALADLQLLRPATVAALLGVTRPTVYRLAKAGRLPAPIRVSHRCSGWRRADVAALLDRPEREAA